MPAGMSFGPNSLWHLVHKLPLLAHHWRFAAPQQAGIRRNTTPDSTEPAFRPKHPKLSRSRDSTHPLRAGRPKEPRKHTSQHFWPPIRQKPKNDPFFCQPLFHGKKLQQGNPARVTPPFGGPTPCFGPKSMGPLSPKLPLLNTAVCRVPHYP